jgi:hypothetical protein
MKLKILSEWSIINEFRNEFNINGKVVNQVTYCVMSDIRWDILIKLFQKFDMLQRYADGMWF